MANLAGNVLNRHENNLWASFVAHPVTKVEKEIRIRTPNFTEPEKGYLLAQVTQKVLIQASIFKRSDLKAPIQFSIEDKSSGLEGSWVVEPQLPQTDFISKVKQWIPFTHVIQQKKIKEVTVKKVESSIASRVTSLFYATPKPTYSFAKLESLPKLEIDCSYNPIHERIFKLPFSDPFTLLSSQCFKTVEPNYVTERSIKGCYRFQLDGNVLSLERLSENPDQKELNANRLVIQKYLKFITEEYGNEHIEYVEHFYGINFKEMIEKGQPLLPDHVFKVNIGVNLIELRHVEDLFVKITQLRRELLTWNKSQTVLILFSSPALKSFSVRELRGLFKIFDPINVKTTVGELDNKLSIFSLDVKPKRINDLPSVMFNHIVRILLPRIEMYPEAFTGRKITHLAIAGYKTMGNKKEFDPCRNLYELLHIFPYLEKREDWTNFFEMLSHVAVKKNLFSSYQSEKNQIEEVWAVGQLLPGPRTADGQDQWFYVSSVTDDDQGDLNYTLKPVNLNYEDRPAPFIKLYRSTASDEEAVNSDDSINADLNPMGSPGALNPDKADKYELSDFIKRTIPVWVGYLLRAQKLEGQNAKATVISDAYLDAFNEFKNYVKLEKQKDKYSVVLQECENCDIGNLKMPLKEFLLSKANQLRELPKYKTSQDIVFVGHSLGGALSQLGMYHFGAAKNRIPCPGFNFKCYAFDPPKTDTEVDLSFMAFGHNHRNLISDLGQKWEIHYLMEYGDIVPKAGESRLGTNGYDEAVDSKWLSFSAKVFRPSEKTNELAMTTLPTHGRRIGLAAKGMDYTETELSPADIYRFDHSWWLGEDLLKVFGYRFARSPQVTEISRRIISIVSFPFRMLAQGFKETMNPPIGKRDADGVFYCDYKPRVLDFK